jgi:hypothetical protein
MNAASFSAILAEAGTDALWQTNPVFCIDRLIARWGPFDSSLAVSSGWLRNVILTLRHRGIRLPPEALKRWIDDGRIPVGYNFTSGWELPNPRVIGLAIDGTGETGFVFPLRPAIASTDWAIDTELPFTPDRVQDGLAGLLMESGVASKRAVPERLAFRFENATRLTARGESMTVAAVLSVLDCMSGQTHSLFRAAVALIELLPGRRLGPVSHISPKLIAARRECGEPSLIVCTSGTSVDASTETTVWEVSSLAELAGRLHGADLLAPLLDAAGPLARPEAARVLDRLRWLAMREPHYRDAADLADRVRACGFAEPADPATLVEFARLHASACRHHGRFVDAVSVGHEAHKRVANLGELGCDDEEADAAAEYAASLFSGHRFADVPTLLQPWAESVAHEPRRFRSLTRVKVWNTLARALAILKLDGWEELFGRSLALHRRLKDLENIDRTIHYLIHARLRHGNTTGARAALAESQGLGEEFGSGNPWAAFLHANLARLENRGWDDPVLDERLTGGAHPYAAWLYVQAAARQPSRKQEDALRRLGQAIALLRQEACGVQGNVCNLFASFLELDAAARSGDTHLWENALTSARGFLSAAPDHRDYYGPSVDSFPAVPEMRFAETLLDFVPYF